MRSVPRVRCDYRGASRFTTWAYKFALLEAGVRLRRRAWQQREVVLEPEVWPLMADAARGPETQVELSELMQALERSINGCLTEHQREVLVALTLNGVPLDVLAERLGTTRGALGGRADERIPGMRAHLEGCPACREDHESLRDFVRQERART